MYSLSQVTAFFISLLIQFVFAFANPCASYFPLVTAVTNTTLIPHTLLLPQVLSADGYTPGDEYTIRIETEGPAKVNTFFIQVQTLDSTPVGTFASTLPSQSVISCHGTNDSLIDASLTTDQNLTFLSVAWTAPSSAMQLTTSLYLVYTLGINSLSYQRYASQHFSLKDFCSPFPCQNSGSCIRLLTGGYSCVCQSNYFGLNCQHFNACATSPCLNMGSCSDQLFGFQCSCLPGYTGRQCEVDIDECELGVNTQSQHPCMFNGMCIDGSNSFSCECQLGYTGDNCQINLDDCTAEVCGDSGTCTDLVADYVCSCEEGTAGRNCEISHQCSSSENLCLNNAVCIKNETTGVITCVCHTGFTGDICSTAINHCVVDMCRNGATCHSMIDRYFCECLAGWEGMDCDVDINECNTRDICNNGICVNTEGSFECFCSNGFAGELCDLNLPDCYNNNCSEYSTCVDGIGEYTCSCPPGRTGVFCGMNLDLCLSSPCRNNATCIDGIFSHTCECTPGYTGASCEIELNECDSSPCLNNGICMDRINGFECVCRDGFTGLCCEVDLDDCVAEPCENGGICKDGINDFTCDCMSGFMGKECAEDVDECLQLLCLNNATCSNAFGSFSCACQSGFNGDLCGNDIDECVTLSQPCLNGGSCVNTVGNYTCDCLPSYKGVMCQTFVPSCDNYDELGNSLDCENNATCIVIENVVTCQCKPGFTGMFCETPFDPCVGATCSANSTCVSQGSTYTCICPPGITGADCSTDVMECAANICENNGSCIELFGSFMCLCGELFSGLKCEIPLNICEISQPCANNGTCSSSLPGTPLFNCTCQLGYTGETCDMQIDYCESNPCSNGNCTTATPPIPSGAPEFTCSCPPGYTGSTCSEDIDECPSEPCSNEATCLNQPGGYSCDCTPGFTGDRCEQEILECQVLKPCLNNGTCIEMIAGYMCECATGYSGDNCSEKIDFCIDSPCNTGSCVSLDEGYRCICPQGVTGPQCAVDIRECASQPCRNNGTCEESFGSFTCLCPSGFSGVLCEEEIDNCVPNPCFNGGICVDSPGGFECFCKLGYTGNFCHIDINDCASSPCLNGGTCVDGAASFSCECTTGYTGPNCSIDVDSCQPSYCENNGTCIDLPSAEGYKCSCMAGYTGVDCGEEINECADRNCSGNGRCFDLLGGYSCLCDTGFSGRDCETQINMCSSYPCANNGTCVETFPFFECICSPGFTGEVCQTDINDCATNPCQQGSTCVDGLNEFMCLCPDGFTGNTCQNEILECTSSPCANNGTCLETAGTGFVCVCGAGYTGDVCQVKIDFCESQAYVTNPCVNGDCVSIGDRFICVCEEGFTGDLCGTQIPSICVVQGTDPCSNNGTCVPDSGTDTGFNCVCSQGYTGERCDIELDECITSEGSSPCLNGMCIDLVGDFYCVCISGYTGRLCDTRLNACVPNPCLNGVCRTVNEQSVCLCYDGYSGDSCEVDIDDCVSSPCQNNATCLDRVNDTVCSCLPGYTGRYCESSFLTCDDSPCLNNGECISDPNEGYRCICPMGITGDTCDIIITFCRVGSCLNGGACVDVSNGFQCVCPTGYTGERCEHFVDFCASSPCSHNATCSSGNASFSCSCPGDYFGIRCQYYNNCVGFDCNYGTCVNIFNSTSKPVTSGSSLIASGLVSCVCYAGHTGQLCELSLDACMQDPYVMCSNRGTCISTGSGEYRCECDLGYAGGNCQTEIPSVYFTEDSYLELLPLPNSLNQYTISLSVQTNDSSALLLYTAQDTSQNEEFFDFLLIQIISGQVRATFDCGSGPGTAQTNFQINDGKVHDISIAREGRSIQLTVDGRVFTDLSAGANTQQILSLPLFIGGVSNYSILPERFRTLNGFTGCVHTLSVSSQVINLPRDYTNAFGLQTCQESYCGYVSCQNGGQCNDDVADFFRCICPDGYRGSFCEVLAITCTSSVNSSDRLASSDTEVICYNGGVCRQVGTSFMCACVLGYTGDSCQQVTQIDVPLFSGTDSFLVYTSLFDLALMFDFSFSFRPLSPDGVILYSSQFPTAPVGDYVLLQMYNGYVQFIFDCGSGRGVLTSSDPIELNTWHSVRAMRVGRVGQLNVNSQPPQTGSSLGVFARLNLAQNLYIGGFDSRAVALPSEVQHSSGLIGCIEQFNSMSQIPLSEATTGLAINPCPESQCNSSHCLHGGTCLESVSRVNSAVTCSCLQGYSGERCQYIIDVCATEAPCLADGICQTTGQGNTFICLCPFGKSGQTCEEDHIPVLPRLSVPHSFLQYPLVPHTSLETWNRIEFSFTLDFSTIAQAESILRNLMYFGSEDSSDFIALVLDSAGATPNLQLQYNLGSGIQTEMGPYVQQGVLYAVSLTRYQRKFTLSLNGDIVLKTSNPGPEMALDLSVSSAVIVIGALSPQLLAHTNSPSNATGARGCLHALTVNLFVYGVSTSVTDGLSISDCLEDICVNSQPCLNDGMCVQSGTSLGSNIVCLCKLGFIGDNCAQEVSIATASFSSYSSLSYPPIPGPISDRFTISLPIKLDTLSGKILLSANQLETEFIRLELIHGVLVLKTHFGEASSVQSLLPSRWYNLTIVITTQRTSVLIDGELYFELVLSNQLPVVTKDALSLFTLGTSVLSQQSFQGCIGNVTINHDDLTILLSPYTAREGRGVSQCVFSRQCSSSVCAEHGVCSLTEELSYSCNCYQGFTGETCEVALYECDNRQVGCVNGGVCKVELVNGMQQFGCICQVPYTGDRCQYKSTLTSAYFNSDSYLGFPSSFISSFKSRTVIELVVMPDSGDGVLFFAQNIQGTSLQDYIYIGMRNSRIEFRFDLGTGSVTLMSRQSVQLGKPISIRAQRNEQAGELYIDGTLEASDKSPGSSTFFAVNNDIYLGGVPNDHLISPFGAQQGFQGCIGSFRVGYETNTIPVAFSSATSGIDIRQC